jgi:hypothetical protein
MFIEYLSMNILKDYKKIKNLKCEFKFRGGKNKKLSAQRSNSNIVWFNFQTSEIGNL